MPNGKTLISVLTASTFLTVGVALAANQAATTPAQSSSRMTQSERDFGTLSKDGSRAYADVALTRLAIFEGQTADAKKLIHEADAALGKAKSDDSVFLKADKDLLTREQVATRRNAANAGADASSPTEPSATPVAWLPVDGAISLADDYRVSPAKVKAVAQANEHLRHGDRRAAMEKLKLADVDMTVVLAVVPLQQTIGEVNQATSLIDAGKYYEGSQVLRKIEDGARYDVSNYLSGPKGRLSYSHESELAPTASSSATTATASADNGPEPYSAPDPTYTPMATMPTFHAPASGPGPQLSEGQQPNASTTAPEPYSAPDPS